MPTIIPDYRIGNDYRNFGGKSKGLFLLKNNGFNVPPFFVVGFNDIKSFIEDKTIILPTVNQWIEENSILNDSLWALRSSADVEDGSINSFAGLFSTEINISTTGIVDSILRIIHNYKSTDHYKYGTESISFSLIIQEMIVPKVSGVIFSKNPLDNQSKNIVINIIPGLGEDLVSGRSEGLNGVSSKGKFSWNNADRNISGHTFNNELKEITVTGRQLMLSIKPYEGELINGVKKLERLMKIPVDVEFAISNNTIYWLQVRPVTAYSSDIEKYIYDNSNIGENYPGISLPLTISFVQYTYFQAYTRLAKYLGMNIKSIVENEFLFANMVGGINGALYYNITAWQQLLYQLPFGKRTSRLIPKLLGMEPVEFVKPKMRAGIRKYLKLLTQIFASFFRLRFHKNNYEVVCKRILEENQNRDFSRLTYFQLVELYRETEKTLVNNWLAPVLNGFYAMIFFSLLKKIVLKSKLLRHYPNFINDVLYSQGDIVSVQIVQDFQELILKIKSDTELYKFINNASGEEVFKNSPSKFPAFSEQINNYLKNYGVRCDSGELKMETVCYSANPLKFIDLLKSSMNNYPVQKDTNKIYDYRKVLKETYKVNWFKRYLLQKLVQTTLPLIRDRENFRFYRTRIFALIRSIFRAMDDDLNANKIIENSGDSLYLELDEILNSAITDDYKKIIDSRKMVYVNYMNEPRSNRYERRGEVYIPVWGPNLNSVSTSLKGVGCCSGIVTGKVRLVTPENVQTGDFQGFILVAEYFEPGWINLFAQAAGIISAKGNLLSHTAILCREMGIPSIIGVKGVTRILKDDDIVQINGSTGEIIISENGE